MLATCSTVSRHMARRSSGSMPKPSSSAREADSPGAEVRAAVRDEVERGDALGDARGMVVAGRHQDDAVAQADALGPLGGGGEEDLGRRGMRVLLEEMVLDFPGVVDAEPIGQLDLGQRILEELLLAALDPRARQLMLVEDAELHVRRTVTRVEVWTGRTASPPRAASTFRRR